MDSSAVDRLRAGLDRLGCSGAELAALCLLAAGAVALLGLLWLRTPGGQPPAGASIAAGPVADGLAVEAEELLVHVAGAVRAPGLYELPGGARVADAVAAAGGAADGALLDQLNLARVVSDGEHLLVPDEAALEASAAGQAGRRPDGRLNLNRASASELEELPGIGPVTAQRILDHREAHGPFTDPRDLLDVSGIGERTYEALAELVGI